MKTYRIKLLAKDLLEAIDKTEWHKDVTANDLPSAWRKFQTQKLAPVYRFSLDPVSIAGDYGISFHSLRVLP